MIFYALIDNTGIRRLQTTKKLGLRDFQNYVGIEGESAYIEIIYNQFSDGLINLSCDEDAHEKELLLTCITNKGIPLCGQVVAAAYTPGGDTIGLTDEQVQIVCDELIVIRRLRTK